MVKQEPLPIKSSTPPQATGAHRAWLVACLAFVLFIVTIILLKDTGRGEGFFALFAGIPYYDKVGHFLLMGVLSFLAVVALAPRLPWMPRAASLAVVGFVLLVVTIEECSQGLVASRNLSLLDLLFSFGGILLFGAWGHRLAHRRGATADC